MKLRQHEGESKDDPNPIETICSTPSQLGWHYVPVCQRLKFLAARGAGYTSIIFSKSAANPVSLENHSAICDDQPSRTLISGCVWLATPHRSLALLTSPPSCPACSTPRSTRRIYGPSRPKRRK